MNNNKPKTLTRRDFLQSLIGMGMAGSLGTLGQLTLMQQAAAATPAFSDYKALVCIFLHGGNDSFNMLVPTGATAGAGYADYSSIRGDLAVADTTLPLTLGSNDYAVNSSASAAYLKGLYDLSAKSIPLGVNGVMPELAQLILDNKASVIANVGNLVEPVTRPEILDKTANLPLFLFAHNHQRRAMQTGQADNLNDIGWAGRIADNWNGINDNSPLGLNISYAGSNRMLIGESTTPLVLASGAPPQYKKMEYQRNNEHNDRRAIFKALAGQQNSSSSGNVSFGPNNTYSTSDPFKQFYNASLLKSQNVFDELSASWPASPLNYSATDPYGNELFSIPASATLDFDDDISGKLIKRLETVATMIHLGASNALSTGNYNRQIFMVNLGGFDTHAAQGSKHPLLLRELSLGLWKFQKAMEELGHANKVMSYTMSDFGRTVSINGGGTDHAWGAHHLVMGGDGNNASGNLAGGKMLGTLPDLRLGGVDDHKDQGRIIPSLAQDQLNATLCDWFGVDETMMATIFPNVGNFKTGSGLSSSYINGLIA